MPGAIGEAERMGCSGEMIVHAKVGDL
jgi:hypothetical protein